MKFLLDTNAVSDLMHNNPHFVAQMAVISANDEVITSATVRGEILYGIKRLPIGKRRAGLESKVAGIFGLLRCEPVTEVTALHYAQLRADQEMLGLVLDQNDLSIAAVALTLNATIVSRDTDLARVIGLKVVDWTV